MKKVNVILVDDHTLFREGLSMLISQFPFIDHVYEAENGAVFLSMIESIRADVIFMDLDMPVMNGIDATEKAIKQKPDINIIALSMYGEEDYYTRMIAAGAKGFILKNSGIEEVRAAILDVCEGKNYFSQEILSGILNSINRKSQPRTSGDLSDREEEVLFHICKGMSNHEISELLHISKRTVDKHRENLLLKTNSRNTAGLVMYAIKNNIVEV